MRVALAADHAGVELKEVLKRLLDELGVDYQDFGANTTDSVDYPDFAADVARAVAPGAFDRPAGRGRAPPAAPRQDHQYRERQVAARPPQAAAGDADRCSIRPRLF